MKLKNIILTGLALMALTACNDYLEVEAPSKQTNEYIFSRESEVSLALNNIYVQMLSNSTYGQNFWTSLTFNNDVEFAANSSDAAGENNFQRFDGSSQGGNASNAWNQLYKSIETANNFIYNLENGPLYENPTEEIYQMMGEAKCMRAMFYYDLTWYFGDVPFTFEPTYIRGDVNTPIPVVDRTTILESLIADLEEIAPHMQGTSECTVERPSQEFAYAMIARIALTAGGYTLRPDTSNPSSYGSMQRPSDYQKYYQIARTAAKKVIDSGTHQLNKSYRQVFIDECNYIINNADDPIFELPFAYQQSGNIGYNQGPQVTSYEDATTGINVWGPSSGNARLNAFYRYSFDPSDLRRDYVVGLWYYLYDGTPTMRADYTTHNNKWSKLWTTGGAGKTLNTNTGSTGINFPYMRYADVLLMFAEAENEVNGPTSEAQEALKTVRRRAFDPADHADLVESYVSSAAASKETFLKAVLNERKWELAGEGSRWRDLVRNNLYSEVLYWTFLRYISVGENAGGSSMYEDAVHEYDGVPERLPENMYYNIVDNPVNINIYPNTTLQVLDILNPYEGVTQHPDHKLTSNFYQWWNDGAGKPTNQCLYSLYGFARADIGGLYKIIENGVEKDFPFPISSTSQLPVVRYILPYPNAAIQRAAGVYKNYYGYSN